MANHCGCSLTTRCQAMWHLRAKLQAHPVDGTEPTRFTRATIALAYTRHLEKAGVAYHHASLLWPLWPDTAFGGAPAQAEEEIADAP